MRKFVEHLHLLGFHNAFSLQTRAISWFVYLVVCCYSLPCRIGCHRQQRATDSSDVTVQFFLHNIISHV